MAKLSKWAVFWRAFLLTLVLGSSGRAQTVDPQDLVEWQRAEETGTPDAYIGYLRMFPTGAFIEQAVTALLDLGVLEQSSPSQTAELY